MSSFAYDGFRMFFGQPLDVLEAGTHVDMTVPARQRGEARNLVDQFTARDEQAACVRPHTVHSQAAASPSANPSTSAGLGQDAVVAWPRHAAGGRHWLTQTGKSAAGIGRAMA